MNRIIIGVDPGVNTGICVYKPELKKIEKLITGDFWDLIDLLHEYQIAGAYLGVIMEDPNGNKPIFNRGVDGRRASKIAQNVGANKRDATLISDYCVRTFISIRGVVPSSRSLTKLSAEQFASITGWTARSSSHSRDAAMLVWGIQ
jgi:hypothetical protein